MSLAVDTAKLRNEIKKKYAEVAHDPSGNHHFDTGRKQADKLRYAAELLEGLPEAAIEAFAGVGNPFLVGEIVAGETVLDVGSGAGFDSLVAARTVGPEGKVVGVDMTDAMLAKAKESARLAGIGHAEFRKGQAEALPVEDESIDVVISNGVVNLCPDKRAVYDEMYRVLRPGGRLMMADIVVQRDVPDAAKEDVDLWTG